MNPKLPAVGGKAISGGAGSIPKGIRSPRRLINAAVTQVMMLLSGTAGSTLLAFVTHLLLTRRLDVGGYGQLVALLAIVNILQVLASYGIGWYWLQLFGSEGWAAFRWIPATIKLTALSSMTAVGLLAGYLLLTGADAAGTYGTTVVLLSAVLLGQSLGETAAARFQLEERYLCLTIWVAATQAGRFGVVGLAIWGGVIDLPHILAGYAVIGLIMATISLFSLNQLRRREINLIGHQPPSATVLEKGKVSLATTFTAASPYCFSTVFYLVYSQGVVAIVERTLGSHEAAMYNAAFLIIAAIYLLPSVIYTKYLVGKIFRWSKHDQDRFAAIFYAGVVGGGLFGMLCMLAVITTAPFVVPILFGGRYREAVPILMLLAIAIPVRFVQHAFGAALFSQENMKRKVRYLAGAALSCLAWSALLIPPFGIAGAALSSILAELTLLGLYAWGVVRHVEPVDVWSSFKVGNMRLALGRLEDRRLPEEELSR